MIELMKKGTYKRINQNFLIEGHEVLEEVDRKDYQPSSDLAKQWNGWAPLYQSK